VKKRILIVDDHPVVRQGLTALIDNEADLTVCAEAAASQAGLDAIAAYGPDLVIADVSVKGGAGLELVHEIRMRHKSLPVLVLSMHEAAIFAERAFDAGACAYVTKLELGEALLIAIRRVLGGEKYASPMVRARIARREPPD